MFFERPNQGERAVLVHISFPGGHAHEDLEEFNELVISAGADPQVWVTGARVSPHSRHFLGEGKLKEIAEAIECYQAEIVLFNHALLPSQERNLERALNCRVLDRVGLILDIFAQRARTHEGKIQVELAQLQHQSTRLIRGWTHLERQKGGIGLRGPGETQLETDRRLLRHRMKTLRARLDKVKAQREQNRKSRRRSGALAVSLVGYTNAGKSTLFNVLTGAEVFAAAKMFATLDPTLKPLDLAHCGEVVIADTVGFIRHLPHQLIQAFRATLQETQEADLLLHVVDASHPERDRHLEQVHAVLAEIGADTLPCLLVYNKIDCLDLNPRIDRDEQGQPERVWVCASQGEGLDLLQQAIAAHLNQVMIEDVIQLTPDQGQLRALLYQVQAVLSEAVADNGDMILNIKLPEIDFKRILSQLNIPVERFLPPKTSEF